MNSITLFSVVVVLCLIEGCVCPSGSSNPNNSNPNNSIWNRSSNLNFSNSNRSSWNNFTSSVLGRFNSFREPTRQPETDDQPAADQPRAFYHTPIMRPRSTLIWPDKPTMPAAQSEINTLVVVDREWMETVDFSEDPSITASGDYIVELACNMYKSRVIVIVMSKYQDDNVEFYLRHLVNVVFRDLIYIRAYFAICPKTIKQYNVSTSPTLVVLVNGQYTYRTDSVDILYRKLKDIYYKGFGTTSTHQAPFELTPSFSGSSSLQSTSSNRQLQGQTSRRQYASGRKSWVPPKKQSIIAQQNDGRVSYPSTVQWPSSARLRVATSDRDFLDKLQSADRQNCVLVEITDENLRKSDDQHLRALLEKYQRLSIIRANNEDCKMTTEAFQVTLLYPSYFLYERNRSKSVQKFYGVSSYEINVKSKLEKKLSELCNN